MKSAASIAAILAVFVVVRVPLLTPEGVLRGWNSDSAVFGLMAKRIHEGEGFDVFFWGQNYLGPLTSSLAALIRRAILDPAGIGLAGGALALRLASMGEIALGICLSFLALTRLFGRAIALGAGLWLSLAPPYFVRLSAVPMGPEMSFLLGSVLLLLGADALTRQRSLLDRPEGRFFFGLVAGLGWWMNQTIVLVLVPVAAVLFLRSAACRELLHTLKQPLGRRPPENTSAIRWNTMAWHVAPFLCGFALADSPVWLGRLLGWYEPSYSFVAPLLPRPGLSSRVARFVGTDFWRLVGLDGAAAPAVLAAAGLALLALLLIRRRKLPVPPFGTGPGSSGLELAGAIVGFGAWVFVLTERGPPQLRYLTPVLPAALALLLVSIAEAALLACRKIPAVLVAFLVGGVAVAGVFFVSREARGVVEGILREPDPRTLLKTIEAEAYTVCHADYWTAYKFQFLSDDRVRFVPYHSFDRNRKQSARLRSAPGPQCLVTEEGLVRPWTANDAADEGGPARRRNRER
jgi:hypothetical protein